MDPFSATPASPFQQPEQQTALDAHAHALISLQSDSLFDTHNSAHENDRAQVEVLLIEAMRTVFEFLSKLIS